MSSWLFSFAAAPGRLAAWVDGLQEEDPALPEDRNDVDIAVDIDLVEKLIWVPGLVGMLKNPEKLAALDETSRLESWGAIYLVQHAHEVEVAVADRAPQGAHHEARIVVRPLDEERLAVQEIARVIDELHRGGLTILRVEQNVGVALRLASVAHIIRDGVIAVTGAARDLVDNPDVVKSYLGG